MESNTPPSTWSAAPLVADESGLAINVTSAATSSVGAKRRKSEPGRVKEFLLYLIGRDVFCSCHVCEEFLNAFRTSWAGKHRIDRNGCTHCHLCQSSRKRHLHRLCDSVVNHLDRNVHGGLARNENDATPICRFHPRQINGATSGRRS